MNDKHTNTSRESIEIPQHSRQGKNPNWIDHIGFGISVFLLVVILGSFRIPESNSEIRYFISGGESNSEEHESKFSYHQERDSGIRNESQQAGGDNLRAESSNTRGELDLDRLARAVGFAETCSCNCGVGASHNNCVGIKENGQFITFPTAASSYHSFKLNWIKHYNGVFPTIKEAQKWTGSDRSEIWLKNVEKHYFQ